MLKKLLEQAKGKTIFLGNGCIDNLYDDTNPKEIVTEFKNNLNKYSFIKIPTCVDAEYAYVYVNEKAYSPQELSGRIFDKEKFRKYLEKGYKKFFYKEGEVYPVPSNAYFISAEELFVGA